MPAITSLPLGSVTVLKQNQVYALPSKLAYIVSSHAVDVSLDKTTWSALANFGTGALTGHVFIRCTTANATVACKDASQVIISSGGGSAALPTAPLGQVLISQGDGVPPIFSASPVVNDLNANGSTYSRYAIYCAEGSISAAYDITPGSHAFIGPGGINGTLANITNSVSGVYGAIVVAGGTNNVLARWDGTNWRVVSSPIATLFDTLSMPQKTLADLSAVTEVGTVANISNSLTDNPGQIVLPGGTNSVLARYNGTNWIVII